MATEAQVTANRCNSQKSTGPRTAEGKAVSSQNAVKHGLFAREAVICGEDQAEFDLHREAFLADLRPVGAMESLLAERIVSLSWRLLRAERMQNEAIDEKIFGIVGGRAARFTRSLIPKGVRQTLADSGAIQRDPSLGRAVAEESLHSWFLDRLLQYERRIETSMFRTIKELSRCQKARKSQQDRACEEKARQGSLPAENRKGDQEKRTQFSPALMCARSAEKTNYDDDLPVGSSGNKAKHGRFAGQTKPSEPAQAQAARVLRRP